MLARKTSSPVISAPSATTAAIPRWSFRLNGNNLANSPAVAMGLAPPQITSGAGTSNPHHLVHRPHRPCHRPQQRSALSFHRSDPGEHAFECAADEPIVASPLCSEHHLTGDVEEKRGVWFSVQTLVKLTVERIYGNRERHAISLLKGASVPQLLLIAVGLGKVGPWVRFAHGEKHEVDLVSEFGMQRIDHRHGTGGHRARDRSRYQE